MATVRFNDTVRRDTVAAMAGRAAELLRIVDLQQLLVRMADENLFSAHRCFRQRHRLAGTQVTRLAPVDQVDVLHVDLANLGRKTIQLSLYAGQSLRRSFLDLVRQV